MSGDIMPFCYSHLGVCSFNWEFSGKNRPIKPVLEPFLEFLFYNVK